MRNPKQRDAAPSFNFDMDPDPTFHFNGDPDPATHQNYENPLGATCPQTHLGSIF
jgi:hypothetical protein